MRNNKNRHNVKQIFCFLLDGVFFHCFFTFENICIRLDALQEKDLLFSQFLLENLAFKTKYYPNSSVL